MDFRYIRLRSAAYDFFLNCETKLTKGPYSVMNSTWYYRDGLLTPAYRQTPGFRIDFEHKGSVVRLRNDMNEYVDVYNGKEGNIQWWTSTDSGNQCWIVEDGCPILPKIEWIQSKWSPIPGIRVAQKLDFESTFRLRQSAVRTFRYPSAINPRAALQHIPIVDINGDKYVRLASDEKITLTPASTNLYRLLNYEERRLARKMVVASQSICFAKSGLHDDAVVHKRPFPLVILSIAGAQFEFRKLEFNDFIVIPKDEEDPNPLCPRFYHKGKKPSYNDARSDKKNPIVGEDCILLLDAYRRSILEDLYLLFHSFNAMIPEGKQGHLRMVGFGLGFFARLDMEYSLTEILRPVFIEALATVLSVYQKDVKRIAIIDFDGKPGEGSLIPPTGTYDYGHIQIRGRKCDLLEPPEDDKYVIGVVNPSDVFSYKGNEFEYESVESVLGNNTDLRYNQVAIFNPYLLQDNHVVVEIPHHLY